MKKRFFKQKRLLVLLGVLVIIVVGLILTLNFKYGAESLKPEKKNFPTQKKYAPGRLLVKFRPEAPKEKVKKVLQEYNATEEREIDKIGVKILKLPSNADEKAYQEAFQNRKEVEFAELDEIIEPAVVPNDPTYPYEWHLSKMQVPAAWDISKGSGVTIAILDSGVDPTHPDLVDHLVPGRNFCGTPGTTCTDPPDDNTSDVISHGTAVAGQAAAVTNNGIGVAAPGWESKIMPIRVSNDIGMGYVSAMVNGLIWAADNGAKVANISFAVSSGSDTLNAGAQYFMRAGGVVSVAAGNSTAFDSNPDNPFILTVNATDYSDGLASFSTTGNCLDLAAPGVSLHTTLSGGTYGAGTGTSGAAPLVASVAALVKSANPNLSPIQIENVIEQSADDLNSSNASGCTPAVGWDNCTGWGRVNAFKAVTLAQNTVPATDQIPPVTTITYPANDAYVSGVIAPIVRVTDNVSIDSVSLVIDSTNLTLTNTETISPTEKIFTYYLDTTLLGNGHKTLTASSRDEANNPSSASVDISIMNTPDTTPPSVYLTAPSPGANATGTIPVSANAYDNAGVAAVDFYANGLVIGSDISSPYSINWNTKTVANGKYTLQAQARDGSGNVGNSSTISVNVYNHSIYDINLDSSINSLDQQVMQGCWFSNVTQRPECATSDLNFDGIVNTLDYGILKEHWNQDAQEPNVNITSPTDGTQLSGRTVEVNVTASDNIGITKIELYLDTTLLQTTTSSPLYLSYNHSKLATGTHTFTAKAYDAVGNMSTTSVRVTK